MSTNAVMIDLKAETQMAESCLVKYDSVIKVDDIDHDSIEDNFDYLVNDLVTDSYHMVALSVCLESSQSHSDSAHRAIIGLQVTLEDD